METNKQIKKNSLCVVLLFISSFGFSTPHITMSPTGNQSYYLCIKPYGQFILTLTEGYCPTHTYTWYNITGDVDCNGSNEPITILTNYPTTTTTYRCHSFNGEIDHDYYFTITVYPYRADFTVSGGTCCNTPATITLSGSVSNDAYHLYKNGVDQNNTKSGTGSSINWTNIYSAGTYTVKDWYGPCQQLMSGYATVNTECCKLLGISDVNETPNIDVKIFPNPNNGNFTLETNSIGEYVLVNDIGQEVKQFKITHNNTIIEIKELKAGIYFLKCVNGSTNQTSKITVIK